MIKTRSGGEGKKMQEILKLKFIKKCLECEFLEKRIMGIKDLNDVIVEKTVEHDSEASKQLIGWIEQNELFDAIWNPKKTHLQLVQRSCDIFRMLLKEDLLMEPQLVQFWNLTKSDYKVEIFKILSDCEFYLEQPQIEYIFN